MFGPFQFVWSMHCLGLVSQRKAVSAREGFLVPTAASVTLLVLSMEEIPSSGTKRSACVSGEKREGGILKDDREGETQKYSSWEGCM